MRVILDLFLFLLLFFSSSALDAIAFELDLWCGGCWKEERKRSHREIVVQIGGFNDK